MALVSCSECRVSISEKATVCPHCGAPVKTERRIGVGTILFGLFVFFIWWVIIDGPSTPKESAAQKQKCRQDLECWVNKYDAWAERRCSKAVEALAKYSHRWTGDTKYPRMRWGDKARGRFVLVGDGIEFQNGFGAWQRSIYQCEYDPALEKVTNVVAEAGRLKN